MYKVFTPFKMRLFAVCGTGCRRAWRPRSRARRLPARRRRCLSLTTRKRRLTGCCLPRMKKRRWRVCARFVSKRRRITRGSATSRPWKGPVACRPAAIGVLSPRQCLHRLLTEHPAALDGGAGATWLNELIWREFYRHLMVYYPKLCKGRPFTAGQIRSPGAQRRPPCRPGSAGRPVFRLLMPPCAS